MVRTLLRVTALSETRLWMTSNFSMDLEIGRGVSSVSIFIRLYLVYFLGADISKKESHIIADMLDLKWSFS